ncbi:TetR/AcrR family transcriptional regulator [Pseudomonas sp. NFR16]|uniref:TetR/AcrR family transcriptional regulator n=1 Tax=Pseudomonas sp. NFR16 TaxID=1566248 RepID=UPI0008B6FDC7|nr:TetR/AcrR family transcriptional regulator [Pseudomonas sp. NFR16]SEJ04013.1 transcriptional regulator, TetR family [Pseudomonas sp. NFR16]
MNTQTDVKQRILDTAGSIIGKKGFSAVGLNEILQTVKVPKGSFYHYFSSKDAFGEALLESYFSGYLAEMDDIFLNPDASEYQKLINYWQGWIHNQTSQQFFGKCLAVKLGAEVADLSESMRQALDRGTAQIIQRLGAAMLRGQQEGSVNLPDTPEKVALMLYELWLGASIMVKITRSAVPFEHTMSATRQILKPLQ